MRYYNSFIFNSSGVMYVSHIERRRGGYALIFYFRLDFVFSEIESQCVSKMSKSYYNVKKWRDLKKKQTESLDNDNIQQCNNYLSELSQPSEEIFKRLW